MALQLKADGKAQGRDSPRAWVLLKLCFPLLFVLPSSSRAEEASLSPAGGCRYLNPLPWGGVRCYHSSLLSCHFASIIFFCCCCWTQNRWEIFPSGLCSWGGSATDQGQFLVHLAPATESKWPGGNPWFNNTTHLWHSHSFSLFFLLFVWLSVSWCHWFFAKISPHWMGTGTDTWSPNLGRFCPSVIINFMFSQY